MANFVPTPRVPVQIISPGADEPEERYLVPRLSVLKQIQERFGDLGKVELSDPTVIAVLVYLLLDDKRAGEDEQYFCEEAVSIPNAAYYMEVVQEALTGASGNGDRPIKAKAARRTGGRSKPSPSSNSESQPDNSGA